MPVKLSDERIYIRCLERSDAEALCALRQRNREFFRPFEPLRPDSDFSLPAVKEHLEAAITQFEQGTSFSFGIFLRETDELIGRVNLSNIVRGAWQNATIGYFLDRQQNGKGYMTEAVKLAVGFSFRHAGLHRVQGAVMPRNQGSIRVLEKAGFRYEGLALRYLQINGVWEDHHIYAVTAEEWRHSV
jgi:ribosomal-protein-alanine N-acetyltransferase